MADLYTGNRARKRSPRTDSDSVSSSDDESAASSDDESAASKPQMSTADRKSQNLLPSATGKSDPPSTSSGNRSVLNSTVPSFATTARVNDSKRIQEAQSRQSIMNRDALMTAVRENELDQVKRLIELGVDVNTPDASGHTALHYAAIEGRLPMVKLLVEKEATADSRTRQGYTPLMLAAKHRQTNVVDFLASDWLKADAAADAARTNASSSDVTPQPKRRPVQPGGKVIEAPLQNDDAAEAEDSISAVVRGDFETAARQIASGRRDLEITNDAELTKLAQAAANGDVEMIRLLLCAGAEIDSQSSGDRSTALMCAIRTRQSAAIDVLLAAGARTDISNRHGNCAAELAVDSGDLGVLKAFVNDGAAGWHINSDKDPLIIRAALAGDVNITKYLLERMAYPRDRDGNHPLALLAIATPMPGKIKGVQTLLQAGADILQKNRHGDTAFTLAAAHGYQDVTKKLIAHPPSGISAGRWTRRLQGTSNRHGRTALMRAVLNKKAEMTAFLLEHGADPHRTDKAGCNAILLAARKGDVSTVKALMKGNASHVATDPKGNTVYATAASHGNSDVLQYFCATEFKNSMVDINTPNHDGDTPLLLAARNGSLGAVKVSLGAGANLLHCNKRGRSALLECARQGDGKVMEKLLAAESSLPEVYPFLDGVIKFIVDRVPALASFMPRPQRPRVRRTDNAGNSALHLVAAHGHHSLLQKMLNPGSSSPAQASKVVGDDSLIETDQDADASSKAVDIDFDLETTNFQGMTPLCLAARNGHVDAALALIKHGAFVNHIDNRGGMPLWYACSIKQSPSVSAGVQAMARPGTPAEKMALAMIDRGALSDQSSLGGQTPLIAASAAGMKSVVERLLAENARVEHADDRGYTALMYAAQYGHVDIVQTLLRKNALCNARPGKTSALALAGAGGHDAVVQLLLDFGAKLDQVDEGGATTLIKALRAGKLSTVKLLIESGADMNPKDQYGNRAIDYAERLGHNDLVRAMMEASQG